MTRSASAKARASAVVDSYSCGSAFGSLTTLWTETLKPPSWAAMLPQKLSPATTFSCPECVAGGPQAIDMTRTAATAQATPPIAQEYCTIDLRKLCAYSGRVARPSPVSDEVKRLLTAGDA